MTTQHPYNEKIWLEANTSIKDAMSNPVRSAGIKMTSQFWLEASTSSIRTYTVLPSRQKLFCINIPALRTGLLTASFEASTALQAEHFKTILIDGAE